MTVTPPNLHRLRRYLRSSRLLDSDRNGWMMMLLSEATNLGEIARKLPQCFLTNDHLERIAEAWEQNKGEPPR